MSTKIIVIGILLFILGGISGALLDAKFQMNRYKLSSLEKQTIDTKDTSYQAGFDDAKKLFDESGMSVLLTPQSTNELSGTVTRIEGDTITFYDKGIKNPFEQVQREHTVRTDANTVFIKMQPKDDEALRTSLRQALDESEKNKGEMLSATPFSSYESLVSSKDQVKTEALISVTLKEGSTDTLLAKEVRIFDTDLPLSVPSLNQ